MDLSSKYSEDGDKETSDHGTKNVNKRKVKKNLREKRKSTGVIIMPDCNNANDENELDSTKVNTLLNEDANQVDSMFGSVHTGVIASDQDALTASDLLAQLNDYKSAIDEWQQAYNTVANELESVREAYQKLQQENSKLKAEYDALMKVVKLMNK